MILVSVVVTVLLWGDLTNRFVWVVLVVTIAFGAVGWVRVGRVAVDPGAVVGTPVPVGRAVSVGADVVAAVDSGAVGCGAGVVCGAVVRGAAVVGAGVFWTTVPEVPAVVGATVSGRMFR